jgi:alcohol/geraniol dehydrogenase (NADP+)
VRPNGALCFVGASPGLVSVPSALLISAQRSICGSDIASPGTIIEMLNFADQHRILPQIETAPMSAVNEGIAKLRQNQVRYRMVLESLKS